MVNILLQNPPMQEEIMALTPFQEIDIVLASYLVSSMRTNVQKKIKIISG